MRPTDSPALPGMVNARLGTSTGVICDSCNRTLACRLDDVRHGDEPRTALVYATRFNGVWSVRLVHCEACGFVFDNCDADEVVAEVELSYARHVMATDGDRGTYLVDDAHLAADYTHADERPDLRGTLE